MTSIPVPTASRTEYRQFWLFMLFALVVLAAGIGLRDPWPSDEPRYVLAARQMVESGDWLFPHRGHELYADKPPLLFWMQAAAYEMLRDWRIAFLLPSLLAGLMTLMLTWDLGRRLWNARTGLYAAIGVLFTFHFMYQVKRAQIDPLVMGWITLANWGLLLHFLRGPNWRAYWLGCFAAGLGVITKGVGVLAVLMFVPYLIARRRMWRDVTQTQDSALRWFGGALAFLAPILVWGGTVLIAAHARGTPEYQAYVDDLFFHQTAGRYAGSWSHPQPFWYYLPVVLFNWFPLSLAYVGALARWRHDLAARDARVLLPLAWALLTILFFSIAHGKRDVYLMPVLPMVALAMAPTLTQVVHARWLRTTALAFALGVGITMAGIGGIGMFGHWAALERFVHDRELDGIGQSVWAVTAAIGAAFLASAAWFRRHRGIYALLAGIAALWIIISVWAYPLLNDGSSAKGIMRHARELAGVDTEIGLVAWKEQNLLMAEGPVHEFGFNLPWNRQYADAVHWLSAAPVQRRLFILADAMGDCVDRTKAIRVGLANRREWWLVGADAVVLGCAPAVEADGEDR
ncbi:MAG: glycosyltransferase family 39 protein [Rhodanobacter sp.]|jgi:4-amino-4-deoxy-L-arabinose transferase-like glycosyltransferase|nr:glycosyltransferase family 39 protein [Rhodanobacter sp.]